MSETRTWTEWGVTPQAAINAGNPTHVLSGMANGIHTESDAQTVQRRLGGIIRRREVTHTLTDWQDVCPHGGPCGQEDELDWCSFEARNPRWNEETKTWDLDPEPERRCGHYMVAECVEAGCDE